MTDARLPRPDAGSPWFKWGDALCRAIQSSLNPITESLPRRSSLRTFPLVLGKSAGDAFTASYPVAIPFRCVLRKSRPGFGVSRSEGFVQISQSFDMISVTDIGFVTFPPGGGAAEIQINEDTFFPELGYVWLFSLSVVSDFSLTLLLDRE